MAISSAVVAGVGNAAQSSNIGIQDFLKILTAQLNNQDPLKPVDNQEFVAQIAQFATLEQSRELNSKIDSLLSLQASTQSVGLLGKTVDLANGQSGTVIEIAPNNGETLLSVRLPDTTVIGNVPMVQISKIH